MVTRVNGLSTMLRWQMQTSIFACGYVDYIPVIRPYIAW